MTEKKRDPLNVAIGRRVYFERTRSGWASPAKFVEHVERETGVRIGKDTLQRVERGEQPMQLPHYIAAMVALGKLTDYALVDLLPPDLRRKRDEIEEQMELARKTVYVKNELNPDVAREISENDSTLRVVWEDPDGGFPVVFVDGRTDWGPAWGSI